MPNPFLSPMPYPAQSLPDREESLATLETFVTRQTNAVLSGPEGSGKSTLLRHFFNTGYCKQLAQNKVLVYMGEFPTGMSGENTYGYFADAVRSSVEILDLCSQSDDCEAILKSLDRSQYDSKKSRFDQYLSKIRMFGYRIIFVLDNFENFTSSHSIQTEHHDLLCGMLNDFKLQLIVATNYDFNEISLPAGNRNSMLLARLSPNKIHLPPLEPESCKTLLEHTLEDAAVPFRFTEGQVRALHKISGGIPLLLNIVARYAYEALAEGTGGRDWEVRVREKALEAALPMLKRWCKIMSGEQLALLPKIASKDGALTVGEQSAARALAARGLLVDAFVLDQDGHRTSTDGYFYNSCLFEDFCQRSEWLQEAQKSNPLRKEPPQQPFYDTAALLNLTGSSPQAPDIPHGGQSFIQIQNPVFITAGDIVGTKQQQTVFDGGSFAKLFQILDLDRNRLMAELEAGFAALSSKRDPAALELHEAEVESTAQQISALFIPKEIDTASPETYAQEQKTLEDRFARVRPTVDPDGLLTDALLDSLTHKCKMYLQVAFVVDDALSTLSDFQLGDLSAQAVMYCKVLEQHLRDNLFVVFHTDPELKYHDTYQKKADTCSKNTFAVRLAGNTHIGDYVCMLRQKAPRLSTLCAEQAVRYKGGNPTKLWWTALCNDVEQARKLRNRIHAGTEIQSGHLQNMRELLFRGDGILQRCTTGRALAEKLGLPLTK